LTGRSFIGLARLRENWFSMELAHCGAMLPAREDGVKRRVPAPTTAGASFPVAIYFSTRAAALLK
jgi:hypothetical protein